ncbi:RNA polymerase sigma factor [Fulvivirga sedimenti]|uniref:Sigma-70 family RNA polymerase sigma factor n=1 Tax=Fulvivirga sedimenti TaxID=2879465 RepID=A0A9X1HQL1_9BACT|nr:sigma-70 family RNA polymerase sigma factor [Fulvivirga sedimenti]MCA6074937.1 sigma-70 family RNA polymerase sigma factor [Fulvivirga sedimenti]MCA6076114.1 sigma-70 family RNA polymerase sigma factor [Fulvivirga sedimenti]MCA6077242.1 sigma-70 family RNA polymerase sigma factor [Fulvivirga sedimenti]
MESEKALIRGCQQGDRLSQRELYDRFAGQMLAISKRYSKSELEAEDILQESFIKIFRNISNFREESSLYFWIKRIVVNTALNSQRSKLYSFPMSDVYELPLHVGEKFTLADFHFEELLQMVRELPDGCQTIFNLFAIEGYTHRDIAGMLGISEGTSKSQYARARSLLQEKILKEKGVTYGSSE